MNQARIREGLRAIAAQESRVPSAAVKVALMHELQRASRARSWKAAAFAGAVAAGLVCFVLLLSSHRTASVEKPVLVPAQAAAVRAAEPTNETQLTPVVVPHSRKRHVRRSAPAAPQVALVEFTEVPFAPPLDAQERAQLVRVSMPAATLESWGFRVNPAEADRVVNADVVVGENGLARAVRLVR